MLKTILIITLIGIILLFALFIYAACVAAGRGGSGQRVYVRTMGAGTCRKEISHPR